MPISDVEQAKQDLVDLNRRIGEMEQRQGPEALAFFATHLSDQLIFRRANGKVVGKLGPGGFVDGLEKPGPFRSREAEDISVDLFNDRALVTLIVVGTRADDGSVHRYRNIRAFSRSGGVWSLTLWYNYEITGL